MLASGDVRLRDGWRRLGAKLSVLERLIEDDEEFVNGLRQKLDYGSAFENGFFIMVSIVLLR